MYVDELRVADERGSLDAVAPRGDVATQGHLALASGLRSLNRSLQRRCQW
jgi:hypothetical protein